MAQITEDYVSFETAKLLKEKGFDVPTTSVWVDHFKLVGCPAAISIYPNKENWNAITGSLKDISTSAPTLQMAMKWLREKGLVVLVDFDVDYDEGENGCRRYHEPLWYFFVYRLCDKHQVSDEDVSFESLEQAYEEGIKYCLENLI